MDLNLTNLGTTKSSYGGTFHEGTSEINVRFGARVREMRQERNLGQEDFAALLLVPTNYLAEIESGQRSASIIDLAGMAHQFKVSISELLIGL